MMTSTPEISRLRTLEAREAARRTGRGMSCVSRNVALPPPAGLYIWER